MIDCPCGYGKNIEESQDNCPVCGTDLVPMQRIKALPLSYLELGRKLEKQGKLDEALEKVMTAVSMRKDLPESFILLGKIYFQKGSYEDAINQFEKALKLEPRNEEILESIKITLEKRNKIKRNLKIFFIIVPVLSFLAGAAICSFSQRAGDVQ